MQDLPLTSPHWCRHPGLASPCGKPYSSHPMAWHDSASCARWLEAKPFEIQSTTNLATTRHSRGHAAASASTLRREKIKTSCCRCCRNDPAVKRNFQRETPQDSMQTLPCLGIRALNMPNFSKVPRPSPAVFLRSPAS